MARKPVATDDTDDVIESLPPPVNLKARREWGKVADRFSRWRPASEELTLVRSVPTRFVQLDRATRVGGFPIERISTVHGPSNHGKTQLCLGLIDSFLTLDHGAALVDAEFTTPHDWCERLMGANARHPAFVAQRPSTYEETANSVREYVKVIAAAREAGDLPEDTSALIVVDSVRKLIPASLLEDVLKVAKSDKGTEMLTGRSGQVKAQVTQAWLDELVPLMGRNRMGIVMIAREIEKDGASADDKKFDCAWAVAGTKGLIFDASLVMRITRAAWVYEGSEEDKKVIGERHRVRIWKTKVEGKEGKFTDCYFHTSNGKYQPYGFDRARDVLELALHYGVVTKSGNWFAHGDERIGMGMNKCCKTLNEKAAWLAKIEAEVRAAFRPDEELEGGTGDD